MIEEMMYKKFMGLTERKQVDYLYTAFVEKDNDTLLKKYGPKKVSLIMEEDFIIIEADTIKDARTVRDKMIMNGLLIHDENITSFDDGVQIDYAYEGQVQPICLN